MIWHDEVIQVEDITLRILGEWSNRYINIVATINLSDGRQGTKTIFNKLINSKMSYEEPSTDDIELAYGQKIEKFKHDMSRDGILRRFGIVESTGHISTPLDSPSARKAQRKSQETQ